MMIANEENWVGVTGRNARSKPTVAVPSSVHGEMLS
jgi:hypothetical protein